MKAHYSFRILYFLLPAGLLALSACSPLSKLPSDKYLLHKYHVENDSLQMDKEEVNSLVRQKPNRRILGVMKLHLGIYHIGSSGDTTVEGRKGLSKFWKKTMKRWFRSIGEEPAILDSSLMEKSRRQMELYLQRKGYFNAVVTDSVEVRKKKFFYALTHPFSSGGADSSHLKHTKKAKVFYTMHPGEPYRIRKVVYQSEDPDVNNILDAVKPDSPIDSGEVYSEDILVDERDRVNAEIRDRGMYYFNKNYITYAVDSSAGNKQVDVLLYVNRKYENIDPALPDSKREPENHHRYHLNNIYIYTDYDSRNEPASLSGDTIWYNGYCFVINPGNDYVKKQAILRAIFIKPGQQFLQRDVDYTYRRLDGLGLFRFINFRFQEAASDSIPDRHLLDVYIHLTPMEKQEYKAETEMTHNGGNLGVAGSIAYRNKNTFRAAETLELKISGGLEALRNFADSTESNRLLFFNTYDIGPELNLGFKQFLLPSFITKGTSRYFNPKTNITTGFNYQERPDFKRVITKFSYGFNWMIGENQRVNINPIGINSVNVKLTSAFENKLLATKDLNLIYSYTNHLITNLSGSWVFSNQASRKGRDFIYIRANGEVSGFVPWMLSRARSFEKDAIGQYIIFGNAFSNYVRPDVDISYHHVFNPNNTLVYRAAGGIGFTFWNSKNQLMPFEKAFFAGGANGIRAWHARTLGPGSYADPLNIENGGDMKLEANIEYRSSIFKALEAALFADAGNIWIRNDRSGALPGAYWKGRRFTEDIAIGGGVGLRFNFVFFIIRTDFAVKLRDPARMPNQWVYTDKKFVIGDTVVNFAIGYPF